MRGGSETTAHPHPTSSVPHPRREDPTGFAKRSFLLLPGTTVRTTAGGWGPVNAHRPESPRPKPREPAQSLEALQMPVGTRLRTVLLHTQASSAGAPQPSLRGAQTGLSRPCPPGPRTGGRGPRAPSRAPGGPGPMGTSHSPEGPAGTGAQRQRERASEQKPRGRQRAPPASASRSRSVFSNPQVLTRPRLLPPPGNQSPSPAAPRSRDCDPQPRAAREAGAGAVGPAPGRRGPAPEAPCAPGRRGRRARHRWLSWVLGPAHNFSDLRGGVVQVTAG